MKKYKCPSCNERIKKRFVYCAWCGAPLQEGHKRQDLGMLGRNDSIGNPLMGQQIKLPFGLNKMMGTLMKQIEKELGVMGGVQPGAMPKGFEIKIQAGKPKAIQEEKPQLIAQESIPASEKTRRDKLPRKEATSTVKRLSDKILYEIDAPGVEKITDVVITPLEKGFEIKAYTKDTCYIKTIPMKVQIQKYGVKKDKVLLELKN